MQPHCGLRWDRALCPSTQGLSVPVHLPWWGNRSHEYTGTRPHKRHTILLINSCCPLLLGDGGAGGEKKEGQIQPRSPALQGEYRLHPVSAKPLSSFASQQQHCRVTSAVLACPEGAGKIRVKRWDINPTVTSDPRLQLCSSSGLLRNQSLLPPRGAHFHPNTADCFSFHCSKWLFLKFICDLG